AIGQFNLGFFIGKLYQEKWVYSRRRPGCPTGPTFPIDSFSNQCQISKDLIPTLANGYGECSIIGSYKLDSADSISPARVRAMLASRACGSSVMIGDPLGRNEMQNNCPHWRPTMRRHLVDMSSLRKHSDENMVL
ncbi:hypothetical protein CRG98_021919, partial [Punica granatum]